MIVCQTHDDCRDNEHCASGQQNCESNEICSDDDADCDGILAADDCDDTRAQSMLRATDTSCEGVVVEASCGEGRQSCGGGTCIGTCTVTQKGTAMWILVNFEEPFDVPPLVVMGPLSYYGTDPAMIRVRDVYTYGFQFQVDEWEYCDGRHPSTETVSFVAVRPDTQAWGPLQVSVGAVQGVGGAWRSVSYERSFGDTPVVLAQRASSNGQHATATRLQSITQTGFSVRIQEQEGNDDEIVAQQIHYLAIAQGEGGTNGHRVRVGVTPAAVTDMWYEVDFGVLDETPHFLAALQSFNGQDPATLRYERLTEAGVSVKAEEEKSLDTETTHAAEVVGWVVVDGQRVTPR